MESAVQGCLWLVWEAFFSSLPRHILRTYNPSKGCKDLTQRREGLEKVRKENHFKKREHHPLRLSWLFLASLRWSFDFSSYLFWCKDVFPINNSLYHPFVLLNRDTESTENT